MVVTLVQGMESRFAITRRESRERPALMLALAERYVELEAAVQKDTPWASPAAPAVAIIAEARRIMAASRAATRRYYERLRAEYPEFCFTHSARVRTEDPDRSGFDLGLAHLPPGFNLMSVRLGSICSDESLYSLGFEMERLGAIDDARRSYGELIQRWPQSRLVPQAYLGIAELLFAEAAGDPSKLPLAEQAYALALGSPPGQNVAFGYAQYQLGRVLARRGKLAPSRLAFQRAIDWAHRYQADFATQLEEAVQRELRF